MSGRSGGMRLDLSIPCVGWTKHCTDTPIRGELGFAPVPEWKSVYIHRELGLFLVVYVDDFKLCGRKENVDRGWELIRPRLQLDPPAPIGRFLGCEHKLKDRMRNGHPVKCVEYDMSEFLESCCDVFCEQFNFKKAGLGSGRVVAPFVTESTRETSQCAGRRTVCNGICCS
eukprot:3094527-Alexandrium_andersonii.AAC.1